VIELPDELAAALKAKAIAAGLTLEAWLHKVGAKQERPPQPSARAYRRCDLRKHARPSVASEKAAPRNKLLRQWER
jgi:hypothetical protein